MTEQTRMNYKMTEADYDEIISTINKVRKTPVIMIQCGMPESPQEAANKAWCKLGDKMGFDGMTVRAGDGPLTFSAFPKGA